MHPPFFSPFTTIPDPSTTLCFSHGYKPPLLDPTHQYALRQLRQKGTLSDFQLQFETIYHRVIAMSARDHLDCFISGLREDISRELRLLRPYCLSQAIEWPHQIEAKLLASQPSVSINSCCKEGTTASVSEAAEGFKEMAPPNRAPDRSKFLPSDSKPFDVAIPFSPEPQPLDVENLSPTYVACTKMEGIIADLSNNRAIEPLLADLDAPTKINGHLP